jgi:hypothetical protein
MFNGTHIYSSFDNKEEYECKILKLYRKKIEIKKNNKISYQDVYFYEIEYQTKVNNKKKNIIKNVILEEVIIVNNE